MPAEGIDTRQHVHHLLWECYTGLIPLSDDIFEDSDLSLPLAGTLDVIGRNPGATVSELARIQPKSQQAISQLVGKLERLGYIERRLGRGRGVGLHLTAAGAAAQGEATVRELRLEARIRGILGDEDYEQARRALERVRAAFTHRSTVEHPNTGAT